MDRPLWRREPAPRSVGHRLWFWLTGLDTRRWSFHVSSSPEQVEAALDRLPPLVRMPSGGQVFVFRRQFGGGRRRLRLLPLRDQGAMVPQFVDRFTVRMMNERSGSRMVVEQRVTRGWAVASSLFLAAGYAFTVFALVAAARGMPAGLLISAVGLAPRYSAFITRLWSPQDLIAVVLAALDVR